MNEPMRFTATDPPPEGEWVVVLGYCFEPYFKIARIEDGLWRDQGQNWFRQLTAYSQWAPFAQSGQLTEEEHCALAYPRDAAKNPRDGERQVG